ncbi:MAG TPA: protein kinase [Polyangiaceae bacterium]|nr:protein kinase [Polyangiaceae bacterium]
MGAERFAPGSIVGDAFKIVRPLSSGGMGAVYVAEQLSTGKLRALKVMHNKLESDPKLRERFVKEARVAASIPSAHVVEVIGAGVEAESGTPWLAMELLEGKDLADHVQTNGTFDVGQTLELLEQVCHAVGAAHDAGIVHRDLKPENIFIAETRAAGRATTVKVLDFGIAKIVAEAQTMGTAALGSPAWMAPEQAEAGGQVTPATDVWALGLIAFWMLTGRCYWRTASQASPSVPAFLKEILFEALPRASQRADELRCADRLPAGFDDWFDRCVHREPAARFRSARELLHAFRLLGGTSVSRTAPTAPVPPVSTRSYIASLDTALVPTAAPVASPTTEAVVLASPPQPYPVPHVPPTPPRRTGLLALLLVGGLGGLLAIAGVLWMMVGKTPPPPPNTSSPEKAPVESVASSESPTIEPVGSIVPSASTAPPTPAKPTSAPVASASSEPKNPPFNRFIAENAVKNRASFTSTHCAKSEGPRSLPMTIVFANTGRVARVEMNPQLRTSQSGFCAFQMMSFIIIPAFSGSEEKVTTAVNLP